MRLTMRHARRKMSNSKRASTHLISLMRNKTKRTLSISSGDLCILVDFIEGFKSKPMHGQSSFQNALCNTQLEKQLLPQGEIALSMLLAVSDNSQLRLLSMLILSLRSKGILIEWRARRVTRRFMRLRIANIFKENDSCLVKAFSFILMLLLLNKTLKSTQTSLIAYLLVISHFLEGIYIHSY